MTETDGSTFVSTITPWLSVRSGKRAVEFYKSAFQAKEVYHMEDPSGAIVSRIVVGGAEFWVSDDIGAENCNSVRMILTVQSPDLVFQQALTAGASEVYPVQDAHGWRVGRLADPFGFHWEIGCPYEE
ncbi:VOC family protein [Neobacillus soli]|uniref:VOC family protein n=1 Tax=Neobacillus soli TaxID=220688 RepID=UPI0008260C5D|nr:VOC family protein [Neobacillus soli]